MNETTLPECGTLSVCSKIDTYDKPWIEKQCRCPEHTGECSSSTLSNDGHTITDKTRHYKVSNGNMLGIFNHVKHLGYLHKRFLLYAAL